MYVIRSAADLGRSLAGLRHAHGLSQAQLAERVGVDRSYIAKLEGGHTSSLLELILDVLSELEASVAVVARDEDPRG